MVKKKPSINQNFEALKAQMQAKRKLAENKFEKEKDEQISTVATVIEHSDINILPNKVDEEYITLNIVDDDDFVQIKNNEEEVLLDDRNEVSNIEVSNNNGSNENDINIKESAFLENTNVQEKEEFIQNIIPKSRKSEPADINMNKIIIKRVEKQEAPKRITYYLKPETIKKIDKFSKATGMGKSEFVQTILDEILNNLEVEK